MSVSGVRDSHGKTRGWKFSKLLLHSAVLSDGGVPVHQLRHGRTVQYSTVQYITVHYITVQYNTIHYSTIISAGSVRDVLRQQDQGSH